MKSRGRSAAVREDDELRLPRPPGIIRRFWARHPITADVIIAVICLFLGLAPATVFTAYETTPGGDLRVIDPSPVIINVILAIMVVGACALLLRRRRWPVAAFVAAYAVAVAYLFLLEPTGGPLLLVTSYTLAVYRSTRAAWTGFGIGIGALALISFILERIDAITLQSALNGVAGQLTLALIGTLIGANVGGRKRYIEAVIDRSRQLLTERDQQAQIAAASERARIAREMHDIVSHSLTVIVALSEGAAATADRDRARDAASAAAATARGALAEMRSMLGVLRDTDSDLPLAPSAPVPPHITVANAQNAGYPVTLTTTGEANVTPAVGFAVGRIVQEGLTNAMRHAPRASRIAVRVGYSADRVVVEIHNDGVTGPIGTTGFGLRGLGERAAHVHGTLRSEPAGEGRWILHAELPAASESSAGTALSDEIEDAP